MQSLESIPTWFSDYMDISLEAAQVILSIFVIFAFLLPVMYLSRGRNSNLPTILTFFLVESLLVGIGWLNVWVLITSVALASAGVAYLGRGAITGG